MSFMDKLKSTVKSGAEQAAAKAQEELDRLQTRRELGQAYAALGEKVFSLVDRGDLAHAELDELVAQVRSLHARLEARDEESAPAGETPPATAAATPEETEEHPPAG
jgi:hypothetical protein